MLDTALSSSSVFEVPIDAISPNPLQPRAAIRAMTSNCVNWPSRFETYGLLQPLLVAVESEDEDETQYQLIAGERRWRAARLAGLTTCRWSSAR